MVLNKAQITRIDGNVTFVNNVYIRQSHILEILDTLHTKQHSLTILPTIEVIRHEDLNIYNSIPGVYTKDTHA